MKRNLAIITTAVSAGLTMVFIILLLCTAFGGLNTEDFDNTLVKTLLFVFSGIYLIDTTVAIYCQAYKGVSAKEVQVASTSGGNVKITPRAVKELIKKNIAGINGVKFRSSALIITETGVQLDLSVCYYGGKKTDETSAYLQALVTDVCRAELDLKLAAVNVRVIGFKSTYVPDPDVIARRAREMRGNAETKEESEIPSDEIAVQTDAEDATAETASPAEELRNILDKLSAEENADGTDNAQAVTVTPAAEETSEEVSE